MRGVSLISAADPEGLGKAYLSIHTAQVQMKVKPMKLILVRLWLRAGHGVGEHAADTQAIARDVRFLTTSDSPRLGTC